MSGPDKTSSKRESPIAVAVFVLAMSLVCGLAWWLAARPELAVDTSPLAQLPTQLGRWTAQTIALEPAVETELRADFNVQRAYSTPGEIPIVLYVGYYGTQRGGRPEHTPRFCYTGAGFGILTSSTVDLSREHALQATEYVVVRDDVEQLVQFWYRSHRRTGMLGGLDQNIDRMLGLLLDGRADGALVRISTDVRNGDRETARSRLRSFGTLIDRALADHWPVEANQAEAFASLADASATTRPGTESNP